MRMGAYFKVDDFFLFDFKGILAGGTNRGKVAMWKHTVYKPQKKKTEGQERWELQSPAVLEGETQLSQIQVKCCRVLARH